MWPNVPNFHKKLYEISRLSDTHNLELVTARFNGEVLPKDDDIWAYKNNWLLELFNGVFNNFMTIDSEIPLLKNECHRLSRDIGRLDNENKFLNEALVQIRSELRELRSKVS